MNIAERYRRWRKLRPDMPASTALDWAKHEQRQADLIMRLDWDFAEGSYGTFAHADLDVAGTAVRVSIGDDEAVDWGDIEPTDEERDNASAYFVAVRIFEGGREAFMDSIGGVDVIGLPGYMQRDWEDAAAYALLEYLLPEAEHYIETESRERAHWAQRDVETV